MVEMDDCLDYTAFLGGSVEQLLIPLEFLNEGFEVVLGERIFTLDHCFAEFDVFHDVDLPLLFNVTVTVGTKGSPRVLMSEVLADGFLLFFGESGLGELFDHQVPECVGVVVWHFGIKEAFLEDFADRVGAIPEDWLYLTSVVIGDVFLAVFDNRLRKDGVFGLEALLALKILVPIKEVLNRLLVFNRKESGDDALGELGFYAETRILVYR